MQNITKDHHAKSTASGILNSAPLTRTWRKHHYSERNQNPLPAKAHELEQIEDLSENPQAIKFIYELAQLHIGALNRASKKDTESTELKEQLKNLCDHLIQITYPTNLLDEINLSKNDLKTLEAIKKETVQGAGPIKSFWKSVKGMAKHTFEDTKEFTTQHPKTAVIGTAIPIGAVAFSYANIQPPAPSAIDPNATCYTNYMEAMLADEPDAQVCDQTQIIDNIALGCHDHLEQLMFGWKKGANFVSETFSLDEKYFEHCSYIANNIYDLNSDAQAIKENWHLRIDLTTLEPMKHVIQNIIPESTWRETLITAMNNTHDFFKAGNDFENALHPLIAAAVAISVYKLGTKGLDELKEVFNNTVDFGRRSAAVPLNYALMTGGSIYAYSANNSFTEAVIGAAAGTLAGEILHRTYRKIKSPDFVKSSTLSVQNDLAAFSNQNHIVSEKSASGHITDTSHEKNFFDKWVNTKTTTFFGGATILTALDLAATGGKVSSSVMGAIAIGIPDLLYNLIEDPSLHAIFAAAGAAIGGTVAGLKRGVQGTKHLLAKTDKDADNTPT